RAHSLWRGQWHQLDCARHAAARAVRAAALPRADGATGAATADRHGVVALSRRPRVRAWRRRLDLRPADGARTRKRSARVGAAPADRAESLTMVTVTASPLRLIVMICAAQVLVQIGAFFWPAFVPDMIPRWNLTNSEAGWITAAFYGAYMLAVPVLV